MLPSGDDNFNQAIAALRTGQLDEAEKLFKKVLRRQPANFAALNLLSVVLTQRERFAEAEPYLRSAIKLNPRSDATLYNYGLVLKALRRPKEALDRFNEALAINASVADTWNNRGTILNDLRRFDDAIADFDKAIALQANYAEAYYNKGRSLVELERYDDATAAFDKALALKPALAEGWLGRGNVFKERRRYDEATRAYDQALALKPNLADAWLGRGNVLHEMRRYDDAFASYDKALSLKADLAEAWLGRGNVLLALKRHEQAIAAYDKALALKPDLAGAWLGRGNVFSELRRYDDAFKAYNKAFTLNPRLVDGEGARFNAKMQICDWKDFETERERLLASVRSGQPNTMPFTLLAIPSSPDDQLRCARTWVETMHPRREPPLWHGRKADHARIRVGYLSADLREHPVSHLIAGVLEHHDRTRFETIALSFGPDDNSKMRERIKASVDSFVDVRTKSDTDIAKLAYDMEIDIAVDLMGFTLDARADIFARRPAPIQVSFIGYLGTMGADYIDYIIADRIVIPEADRPFYSEKVACLPHSFQPNYRDRAVDPDNRDRAGLGLPPEGFVFCCFNNNFKITPDVFASWMRILARVPGSVFWLLAESPAVERALKAAAAADGVDAKRLIFAPRVPLAEHQARLAAADLFLDTSPYNAGATAGDALWAGLPVLTRLGNTFSGRMGASLLNAIQLPELVTATPEAYEQMAVQLATHPGELAAIRSRLIENRLTAPLFDTALSAKHLEAAYTAMVERHRAGLPPDHIEIPAS